LKKRVYCDEASQHIALISHQVNQCMYDALKASRVAQHRLENMVVFVVGGSDGSSGGIGWPLARWTFTKLAEASR